MRIVAWILLPCGGTIRAAAVRAGVVPRYWAVICAFRPARTQISGALTSGSGRVTRWVAATMRLAVAGGADATPAPSPPSSVVPQTALSGVDTQKQVP